MQLGAVCPGVRERQGQAEPRQLLATKQLRLSEARQGRVRS